MTDLKNKGDFWEHLDILRVAIIKIIVVWGILSIVAFVLKEQLFNVVLAPRNPNFITYRLIDFLSAKYGFEALERIDISLINTGLAQQFIIHMKTAMCAGLILAAPYALYQIFVFISPGLYENERHYASRIVVGGYIMFAVGVLCSYFIIFPMTFRFLGTYQVAGDVTNMISIESYMGTLIIMSLCMGVVFELPLLAWIFSRMGWISSKWMSTYRKHAIVVILIVSAIITPTSDVFTLLLVATPICLLYEVSILIVRRSEKRLLTPEN